MESITIYLKDSKKMSFLKELLNQFDFIIVDDSLKKRKKTSEKKHDFFASAGIWKGRNITQEDLRAKAWKKN
jgi:hypothetical protein